jgi:hypothetical protein
MALLGGAAAVGAMLFYNHQKNKNALDKASDTLEVGRYASREALQGDSRPMGQQISDSAAKNYYEAKKAMQK